MMGGDLHAAEMCLIHLMDIYFIQKGIKQSFLHLWSKEVKERWSWGSPPGALGYFLSIRFSDAVEWQNNAKEIYEKLKNYEA